MGKIGVGVGEDFPVGDPGDPTKAPGEAGQAEAAPHETAGNASAQSDASDDRAEFERWKWRREGERAWAEDMRNQRSEGDPRNRAEWDAWKRTFKDRIRAAVIDGLGRDDNWRRHSWGTTWRPRFWPLGAWGIGIALLVLAIPVLVIVAIVALIAAAISAPLTILAALAALILLSVALRHRHGHHTGHYRYYTDNDIQSPPRSSRASCPRPRGPIVTPPPQEHS
jgi:hypothetical protein